MTIQTFARSNTRPLARHRLRVSAAMVLMAATWSLAASAQEAYPTKPVKVVVAFSAGGTTDILARSVGQALTEKFKQSFIVDNRPGAGGNIGTEMVVRAPADGYTLIINSVGPIAVNQSLYRKLNYDPLKDLVPVVQIADVPNVLVVHPSLPAKSMAEFVTYAKANAGKLNYASTGVGTSSHLASFMLSQRMKADAIHVPYKGADALNDLLAGRVQFMFATIPSVIAHIKSGKLRAIAVSSPRRSRSMPDVPTVAETGFPGFEAGSWFGVFAPKGTPTAIVTSLNRAVNDALPALQEQMVREGADPIGGSAEQFGAFTRKEYEKWKVVVRESGAAVD